ncbi:MAG: acetoacetate decarboxylase family protein [Deltaproteobacteria bacterium]|nr:acetoacetate decarboxylase family protein [Deltaproteobacteria bacterium]MCL5277253.1 acetoacetate decarboxylase family protein [Deltaproteobacteria bacterium]
MDRSFFNNVRQQTVRLSEREVQLPILYYDVSAFASSFTVPTRLIKGILPSKHMRPAEILPGRSVVTIAAFEYRDTSVGPYNEVGITIPVLLDPIINLPVLPLLLEKRYKKLGFYVHHLPVTTKVAHDAGREVWGYPKFIGEIAFEDKDSVLTMSLAEKGELILRVRLDRSAFGGRRPSPYFWDFRTYTIKDGKILKTVVATRSLYLRTMKRGASTLELGSHRISGELASWDVAKDSIDTRWMPDFQSILPEAESRYDQ